MTMARMTMRAKRVDDPFGINSLFWLFLFFSHESSQSGHIERLLSHIRAFATLARWNLF